MLKKSLSYKSKKLEGTKSQAYEEEDEDNFVQSPESAKLHKI